MESRLKDDRWQSVYLRLPCGSKNHTIYKAYGKLEADKLFDTMEQMPIQIKNTLTNEVFKEAGRLKAKYKLSIADSIAIAETAINKGSLVTADHHEIEPIEIAEKINVTWFR